MKKLLFMVLMITILCGMGFAVEKAISVNGHGEINIDPDVAYVRFGVEAVEDTAMKAQTKNAERMNKLIDSLIAAGVNKDDIETSSFSLSTLMDYSQSKAPKITGYRCDNQVTVTLNNLDAVGKVLDTAITAGASSVQGVTFSIKDETKIKLLALEKAVENAKGKARAIEGAAGLQIKKVHSIIESGAQVIPFEMARNDMMMAAAAPTPIMAGKIKVTADVTVNYEF